MADHRYYEAWKRNPQSFPKVQPTTASAKSAKVAPTSTVQVRLDTPGGVTYSPDELHSHNIVKRLFIPYKLGEGSGTRPIDDEDGEEVYDFDKDLQKEAMLGSDREEKDEGISAAQAYALSIDFDKLAEQRALATREPDSHMRSDEEDEDGTYNFDKMSLSGQSKMSTNSQMSVATLATMSTAKKDGSLPDWYTRVSARKDEVPFLVPAGLTGRSTDHKRPWDAMRWHGHRAFERPSQREREAGIAAFEDVNGIGRAPSISETFDSKHSSAGKDGDSKTMMTSRTGRTIRSLNVPVLFVIDPRRTHTLRMVRRTDPRQVLLICNGIYKEASQVASSKAAEAAKQAGIDIKQLTSNSKEAQKLLESVYANAKPRGGIGVVYCPHEDVLNQNDDNLKDQDPRIDVNCAKRLEAPPVFTELTEKRAQLRAVLAAIELADWEQEGFDKIVIGVEQDWIIRGISNDIWRWKYNGWKTPVGELVQDRDLWELIDLAIIGFEKIDCNVRFWQISAKDAQIAKSLAEIGAMKDFQRPKLVRWRRKRPTVLKERARASVKINHQGPVLSEVSKHGIE